MTVYLPGLVLLFLLRCVSLAAVTGIKMCERKCFETKDCQAIAFDVSSLNCGILMDEKNIQNNKALVIKKNSKHITFPVICSPGERCITTKKEHHVCVKDEVKPRGHRIFILPCQQIDVATAFVFDPHTKEVVPYPFFWLHVKNGLYLNAERSLFLVLRDSLISTSEGTSASSVLWRKIQIHQLSFDDRIGMIFLISSEGYRMFLNRVNPQGKMKKTFHVRGLSNVETMNVDARTKTLYLGMKGSFGVLTYEGQFRQLMEFGDVYRPLYTDVLRHTVFVYEKDGTLVRITMTGSKTVAGTLKEGDKQVFPRTPVQVSNDLYFTSFNRKGAIFAILNLYEDPQLLLIKQLGVNKKDPQFILV